MYKLPFQIRNDIKLTMFQYKVVENILATEASLFRAKICDYNVFPQCLNKTHSLDHMFFRCSSVVACVAGGYYCVSRRVRFGGDAAMSDVSREKWKSNASFPLLDHGSVAKILITHRDDTASYAGYLCSCLLAFWRTFQIWRTNKTGKPWHNQSVLMILYGVFNIVKTHTYNNPGFSRSVWTSSYILG